MKNINKSIKELLNFSFINLDKPTGPTSFKVSQFVKDLFNLSKTSHLGTLDPQVTGVLPVALGRACKLSDYFMHKDKTYIGIMRLHEYISEDKLKEEMEKFKGKITQLPPIRSSVKRAERVREIKEFMIIEKDGKDILFFSKVQAGTYIRKLCHDLGENIGGAHMLELRRTQASIFSEDDKTFINLYDLEKAYNQYKEGDEEPLRYILIPAEEAIKRVLPVVQLNPKDLKHVLTGKPLTKDDLKEIPKEDTFAVFLKDKFIEIAKKTNEDNIIARPEFVFN